MQDETQRSSWSGKLSQHSLMVAVNVQKVGAVSHQLEKERMMSLEEAVVENLRNLPVDKQQEVLDFVQFLRQKSAASRQQTPLRGLWAGVNITEDDIAEVRREM